MPGRGSYGAAGRWIHDRAHHILGKNPDMDKSVAYAVATQQSHKVGKSPKRFRTPEGVRTALSKHRFPKKWYKKTASAVTTEKTAAKRKALDVLHSLQKSAGVPAIRINWSKSAPKKSRRRLKALRTGWPRAQYPILSEPGVGNRAQLWLDDLADRIRNSKRKAAPRPLPKRPPPTRTARVHEKTVPIAPAQQAARVPHSPPVPPPAASAPKAQKRAPKKRKTKKQRLQQPPASRPTPSQPAAPPTRKTYPPGAFSSPTPRAAVPQATRRGTVPATPRAARGAVNPQAAEVAQGAVSPQAIETARESVAPPSVTSRLAGLSLSPQTLKSGLRVAGLGTAGVGTGALLHQGAHSLGITDTGPSDVLAGLVVPTAKQAQDSRAIRSLMEEKGMYIPRYYLEKAAAAMAGAVESNDEDQHTGEPGMFGPESSVIPQQTLETVVPIGRHVEKSDDESAGFLEKMFKSYTDSKEEVVGRYLRGETEIPLKKQAGRLVV